VECLFQCDVKITVYDFAIACSRRPGEGENGKNLHYNRT